MLFHLVHPHGLPAGALQAPLVSYPPGAPALQRAPWGAGNSSSARLALRAFPQGLRAQLKAAQPPFSLRSSTTTNCTPGTLGGECQQNPTRVVSAPNDQKSRRCNTTPDSLPPRRVRPTRGRNAVLRPRLYGANPQYWFQVGTQRTSGRNGSGVLV